MKQGMCRIVLKGAGALLALFLLAMTVPGCMSVQAAMAAPRTPGLHRGVGQGFRGSIHVLVLVDDTGGIAEIEITGYDDDEFTGGAAMEELLALVLETNSTDLDAISGATESSAGFLAAVENALGR
jgi:uncharacterized protein with FMN-binding domain